MKESTRTGIYVVLGVLVLIAGWVVARPRTVEYQVVDDTGTRFFGEFDPLQAASLEIVSVNQETMSVRTFKVAQQNGRWVIPSKEGYPADAKDHLATAATSVMDLMKGTIASDLSNDHELYGVADPTALGAAGTPSLGSGTRVTLKDSADKVLVDFILGKTVKDKPELRYVRIPGRDRVYTAAVNIDSLSTKFEDWIERDLLQIDSNLIKEVVVDDYAVDLANQRVNRGERLTLRRNVETNTWSMEPAPAESESLATPKLDEMRSALDNLQIADVHRKPTGLSAQLQTEETMQIDNEAASSLMNRGYYIVGGRLISNQGDTIVRTSEGVEYTLRFGERVNFETGSLAGEESASDAANLGRYLFVTVRFDPGLIDTPELQPVPEEEPAAATGEENQTASDARQAIINANEEKLAEHQKKLNEGEKKVRDLNARFANWYYVVSDSVYQQIRLKRSDLITTTPADSVHPTDSANTSE